MSVLRKKRNISKTKINFWQDLLTFCLLLAAILTAFTDTRLHTWLGLGMAVAVFIHLILHWRWLLSMSGRFMKKMGHQIRFKVILDLALLIVFLLLMGSGIIVALIYAPNVTAFHNLCFYLFAVLTTLHLTLNWKWILHHGRRVLNIPSLLDTISTISRQIKPTIPES
ncbi:MAG: DUF4405 domain-containing protein [Ardenticatenaceae bacterium]|nr:DUF4405 domain-containing protein [Ardenticatenaceae bacterium]